MKGHYLSMQLSLHVSEIAGNIEIKLFLSTFDELRKHESRRETYFQSSSRNTAKTENQSRILESEATN